MIKCDIVWFWVFVGFFYQFGHELIRTMGNKVLVNFLKVIKMLMYTV